MIYFKLLFLTLPIIPLFNLIYFKNGLTSIGIYNYIDEYILLLTCISLGVLFLFLKENIFKIFLIFFTSILISFFCLEIYIISTLQNKNKIGDRNEINLYDEYLKLKSLGIKGLHVPPINYLNNSQIKKKLPLSNISNSLLMVCNENNYYSIINTDRFGFNNPDKEWEKKKFNFIFLGDSFTDGYCVNEQHSIPGNFRNKGFNGGILNLGFGGNGPLLEYATLKEYFPKKSVDVVYWIYYHGNDLADLNTELRNDILKKYFENVNFKQNLIIKKEELEKIIKYQSIQNLETYKKISQNKKKPFQYKNFIKLAYSRKIFRDLIDNYINLSPPIEFLKILKNTNKFLKNNNTKLIFVYLPKNNNIKPNEKFVKVIRKLDIDVIDLGDKLTNYKNKRSLFPKSGIYHFNEFGYKIVSEIIYKNSKLNFN